MSEKQLTRQELYDEIKKSSKDSFILEEMKRLGFWDASKPKIAQDLIDKKVELQKELNQLSRKIKNPETVIKEIHQQRMKDALQRREETKAKREVTLEEAKKQRELKKENEIGFIGKAFIHALDKKESDSKLLAQNTLFPIEDAKDLASKMGITLGELRFLTYTQKLSPKTNYICFKMAKKTGGFREISAPKPKLKRLQYWILENILNKIEISDKAHGFVPKKSIVSNAFPHLGQSVVINCDLENFFPTLTYGRVRGMFERLGYSLEIATLLAILTTQEEQKEVVLDGQKLYLFTGNRYLPQGSPASPMITNIICRKLDKRMNGMAKKLNFNYSRYADDMTFSSLEYNNINKMLFWIKGITKEEGFILHPKKTKIMKKGSRQEVTGIVVNEKLSINKKELKKFRALLYQIEQSGIEGKTWRKSTSENLIATIWGYANFIAMVDSVKGEIYLAQVKAIMQKYSFTPQSFSASEFREKSANGEYPLVVKTEKEEVIKDKDPEEERVKEETKEKEPSFLDDILNMFRK